MTVLTDIEHIDRKAWRQLIATSSVASWFQTPEAYDFFASVPTSVKPFVVAVEDKRLQSVIVGYTVAEGGPLKRFFSKRTIIQGGPLLADDISDEALKALLEAIPRNGIYCEMRNFSDYSKWRKVFEQAGWDYKPHYDVYMATTAGWQNKLQDTKKRQVNKALKDGYSWHEANNEDEVRTWYFQLKQLYRNKVHRPLFGYDFFLTAWKQGFCKVLIVNDGYGNITGGALVPVMNQTAYEWYICGSVMATYALQDWCEKNGITRLDAVGAGEPNKEYGVRDFKLRMAGELHEFGRFIRIQAKTRYRLGVWVINLL